MKKLNEMLRMYIMRAGYTIYGFAKTTGIKRPTLEKILLGNMKLSKETMEQMLAHLQLAPAELEELIELQQMQEFGEDAYRLREYIRQFLIRTSEQVQSQLLLEEKQKTNVEQTENILVQKQEMNCISGLAEVSDKIEVCLKEELLESNASIKINISSRYHMFYDILWGVMKIYERDLVLQHLVMVEDIGKHRVENHLNVLEKALPCAFISHLKYTLHCAFVSSEVSELGRYGFPYYMIGTKWCMLLSADWSMAVFSRNIVLIKYLWTLADHQEKHAFSMIKVYENALQALPWLNQTMEKDIYVIGNQPCMLPFVDREMIERYMSGYGKELIENISERSAILQKQDMLCCIFTKDGLYRFVETGQLDEVPQSYKESISLEDRIYILEKMYQEIEERNRQYRIINPNILPLAQNFMFMIEGKYMMVAGFLTTKQYCRYIVIEDRYLAEPMQRFLLSIMSSYGCYQKEAVLKEIRSCIERLKNQNK